MKIAICDDLKEYLDKINQSLKFYLKDKNIHDCEIDRYDNPLLFLDAIEKNGGYDILLLDICMPGISGTSVAHEIRRRHDRTEIVFLTTSDEFAVDAFALKAAHYLIKPYSKDEFSEAMDRAFFKFNLGEAKKLSVKTDGGNIRLIDISEILYIESIAHCQTVHLKEYNCTEMRQSLSKMLDELEKLSPGQFICPIKGFVVNQKAIVSIEPKHINLRNGIKIPIARNTFRQLSEQYFKYMFEGGSSL